MEDAAVAEPQVEAKKDDLYTRHVEGFIAAAKEDFDRALNQYGFTVWHSLPPKEAAHFKERLGARPLEAPDLYNRGTAHAMEEEWSDAVSDLRAALKLDPDYAPAAFNLAVCLEKLERLGEARDAYLNYLKILDRARDRRDIRLGVPIDLAQETARIRQRLETLGKS